MSKARTIDQHMQAFAVENAHFTPIDLAQIKKLAIEVRTDIILEKAERNCLENTCQKEVKP